jgi:hypothetical protein
VIERESELGRGARKEKELDFQCPTSEATLRHQPLTLIFNKGTSSHDAPRSRAVSTERTILSPSTKEYRALAADIGVRLFLKGGTSVNPL